MGQWFRLMGIRGLRLFYTPCMRELRRNIWLFSVHSKNRRLLSSIRPRTSLLTSPT